MTFDDFRQSLTASEPPAGLTLALKGYGAMVGCEGRLDDGARIRPAGRRPRRLAGTCLLTRKEGDAGNADYW
jgi:hypothetical protein